MPTSNEAVASALISLAILALVVPQKACLLMERNLRYFRTPNSRFTGFSLLSDHTFSVMECASLCSEYTQCASYNFNRRSSLCELYDDATSDNSDLKDELGTDYFIPCSHLSVSTTFY